MEIREHVQLAPYTTFGIGGPADYFVIVSTRDEIVEAIEWAKDSSLHSGRQLPFFLLGTGANILVGDKGYRGLVIKNEAKQTILAQSLLTVESGATIADIIQFTLEKGLSGFEHFAGIPSSIGGALWQNLHFLSADRSRTFYIEELVTAADLYTEEGEHKTVGKDYFQFGYDESILHKRHDIVLSATFTLTPEDSKIIEKKIAANIEWRSEKHPTGAVGRSAGSVFKKIDGFGAGRLIEQVGLKGKQIGGAKISDQHANFILNEHGASAVDVRSLIDLVQQKVQHELGLTMQTEISFVGDF